MVTQLRGRVHAIVVDLESVAALLTRVHRSDPQKLRAEWAAISGAELFVRSEDVDKANDALHRLSATCVAKFAGDVIDENPAFPDN